MREMKRLSSWTVAVVGVCAIAVVSNACAAGGSATSPTSLALTPSATSSTAVVGGVDGPLTALIRAVANCGNQGDVIDVLQRVFAGTGHSPAVEVLSDGAGILTFRLGTAVFQVFYNDMDGDNHLSCGDQVTGATP
jgi:hypothetical protein